MRKTISAMEARHNFGQVMNEVFLRDDEYVIERAGKPLVVMISVDKYKQLQQAQEEARKAFFQVVDKTHERNKDLKPQVIEQEVDDAVRAVRAARQRKGQSAHV